MRFLLIIIGLLLVVMVQGQSNEKHRVYFEQGQASISLEQLEEIKNLAKESMAKSNGRVVVHTYANDALEGDFNDRLSGRRAYLVQQCLERAGVPLGHMQIESKIQSTSSENCSACAEILVTTDSNFFSQNVYQDHIADFLMEGSGVYAQTFWIHPFRDVELTTKDGVLIQIPSGALSARDSGLVKFEVRFLKTKWEMLLHSLTTRATGQEFLALNRVVQLNAAQYGETLNVQKGHTITIVVPSDVYSKDAQLYQQKENRWDRPAAPAYVKTGSFYIGDDYWCSNLDENALTVPNYATPPTKPIYLEYDSMTIKQDEQLNSIQIRLDYLAEQKVNKKGKPQELTAQQKRNECVLKNKKDRLLIAKEKIKIETRQKNEEREAVYYQSLAVYNQERHLLQRSYLKGLDSIGGVQRSNINRCAELKQGVEDLKKTYGQADYEKMAARLRNQAIKDKLGYWIQTNQLGWLSVGNIAQRKDTDAVPYRVTTGISAYKVTAFLIFNETKDIVIGETLDATDIVFWEVPDGSKAKLFAVTQEGDNFLIAFHDLTTNGNPIELEFRQVSLEQILDALR
ncbi:OmpA family protein [Aureispira anguillae]|uniref:OmpA family protein n=1 Tax=Aureispira anguillae TaxID=2864201 RepID=A0A915YJ56_9BACT|nr:hypothetical protein [Aureispira anguillae]BDS14025.1 hypothetical protein AsAng_0047880 [Aureispira anguillae]